MKGLKRGQGAFKSGSINNQFEGTISIYTNSAGKTVELYFPKRVAAESNRPILGRYPIRKSGFCDQTTQDVWRALLSQRDLMGLLPERKTDIFHPLERGVKTNPAAMALEHQAQI